MQRIPVQAPPLDNDVSDTPPVDQRDEGISGSEDKENVEKIEKDEGMMLS